MTFHVDSEVGQLKQVILHRPGLELSRLTPSNVHDLLFDDVMWAERAREEHDVFAQKLRDKGITVYLFAELLGEALEQPGAKDFLKERLTTATQFGPALDKPLDDLVDATPARQLAELLIGGVLKRDVPDPGTTSLLWSYLDDEDFLLTPLPNHLFQRDNSAWVYDGLSVHPMAKPARKRETLHSRIIWNFHPLFRDAGLHFYYGNDDLRHEPATVEGGDILVIGNGAVMIGMGERTTPQGVEMLARSYFSLGDGQPGDRRRAAQGPSVHAPRHRDDDDRPGRLLGLPVPRPGAAVLHADPARRPAATTTWWRTPTCSPWSPRRSGWTRSGCSRRRSTSRAPSASSGTTATTSWPSPPE